MSRHVLLLLPLATLWISFPNPSPGAEPIWRWVEGEEA